MREQLLMDKQAVNKVGLLRMALLMLPAMIVAGAPCFAGEHWQWGERYSRNMITDEKGLPVHFDLESGENILWSVPLGGGAYGSPLAAAGRIFVGANNSEPRDPRRQGDRGVVLCLDQEDGSMRWQLVIPRIGGDQYLDWPAIGICSPPTVEGDRVYTVTNRAQVVCLDLNGFENGNTGPFMEEGRVMAPPEEPPMEAGPSDADIVWLFDMRAEVGQYPHDSPFVSILLDGDYLYLNTSNGVDNTHLRVGNPEAPSLIVLNKHTGQLVAKDGEGLGPRIFHAVWAPPSLGVVGDKRLIFFGGPEGVCYAFKALSAPSPDTVQTLERVWRFDCDPDGPKEDHFSYSTNIHEGPSQIVGMPVVFKDRVYVVAGGDVWWGKRQSWLKCIDATQTGDITTAAEKWSYPIARQNTSTPAILNGLVFVTDDAGYVHCLDAETGEAYWTHRLGRSIWGSALGATDRIYVGARNGAFAIMAADKTKNILFETRFPDEITSTPAAANGVLFVNTLSRLYAIGGKQNQ